MEDLTKDAIKATLWEYCANCTKNDPMKVEIENLKNELSEVKESVKLINSNFSTLLWWVIGLLVASLGGIIYIIIDKFVLHG